MALEYTKIVVEDFDLGRDTVQVPAPAGGTLTGHQIHPGAFYPFAVDKFGAVGDGVADDTSAIQAAIDAAADAGGVVWFPNGRYRVIGTLTLTASGVQVVGESRAGAVIVFDDTADRGLVIDTVTAADAVTSLLTVDAAIGDRTVTVADGSVFAVGAWAFVDDSGTHTGTHLSRIKSISGNVLTLDDAVPCPITVANTGTVYSYVAHPLLEGIEVRDLTLTCAVTVPTAKQTLLLVSRCVDARVRNCRFEASTGPLLTARTCYHLAITESTFTHGATVGNSACEIQTSSGTRIQGCTATLCQFGFVTTASAYTRIASNRVNGRLSTVDLGRGIKLQDASNFSSVVNNVVADTNLYGIYLQDTAHTSVTGNSIQSCGVDAGEHGIQLGGFIDGAAHHNTVAGNQVANVTGYGVAINSGNGVSTYNAITGNALHGVQGAVFCNTSHNTITGNACSGDGATVSGGIVRVTFGGDYNVVTGNAITNTGSGIPNAISTSGGGGHNTIGSNAIGANLALSFAGTDTIAATQAYVEAALPKLPIYNGTEIATGADTSEVTAWTFTIPANTLSAATQGFRLRGVCTFADTPVTKYVRVYVGGATFVGQLSNASLAVPTSAFAAEFDCEAFYRSNVATSVWCNFWSTRVTSLGYTPGGTHANVSIDWTVDQTITVTIQGGGNAGDLTFHMGKFEYSASVRHG